MTRDQLRLRREIAACGRQCERWAGRAVQSRCLGLDVLARADVLNARDCAVQAFAASRELARVSP